MEVLHPVVNFLNDLMEVHKEEPPRYDLRVSSLPYCSILDALERKKAEPFPIGFEFDFYTSVGTTIHTLLQTWLPTLENSTCKVFGNWKCNKCQSEWITCFEPSFENRNETKQCHSDCPKHLEYVELAFKYHNVSGHLDMLVQDSKGNWHALEFKSTSSYLSDDPKSASKYFPQPKHKVQIETYSTLLWLEYKIKVDEYHVVYVSRNKVAKSRLSGKGLEKWSFNSFNFPFTKKIYDFRRNHLRNSIKGYRKVELLKQAEDKQIVSLVKDIVKYKPCKIEQDYADMLSSKFFGDEQCEFYKNGMCFKETNVMEKIVTERLLQKD